MTALSSSNLSNAWRLIKAYMAAYPVRGSLAVCGLILAGLLESVGFLSLVPLLGIFMGGSEDVSHHESAISRYMGEAFTAMGFQPDFTLLLVLIVLLISGKALLVMVAMRHVGYTTMAIGRDMRHDLLHALMRARWSYFAGQSIGNFGNAINIEAVNASSACQTSINFVSICIQILFYLAASFLVSWQVTLAVIVVGSSMWLVLQWTVRKAQEAGLLQTESYRALSSTLVDGLQGIKSIKAMGREQRMASMLGSEIQALQVAKVETVRNSELLKAIQEIIVIIGIAAGIYVANTYGGIPMVEIMVMALLFNRVLGRVANVQIMLQKTANTESSFWLLRQLIEETRRHEEKDSGVEEITLQREIRFDAVEFAHDTHRILERASCTIPVNG
ncbi:MAG: ABC transporter ATP-binding protein, partial [Magnetococcales bacterium]|nr:ABC transporter ATP-binding protein [Magnetococcales bacterium]